MRVSVRLFDCAANCKLGKGRIAERSTALLAGSWVRGGGWLHICCTTYSLRRVEMAVTTTLLAESWVRGGGWLHIRTTYCAAG
jgi:hypothetical protein